MREGRANEAAEAIEMSNVNPRPRPTLFALSAVPRFIIEDPTGVSFCPGHAIEALRMGKL